VLAERFPGVPRIALTATADALTRKEIIERLHLQNAREFVSSFDRPNIRYRDCREGQRTQAAPRIHSRRTRGEAGIVYCLSRNTVDETAEFLADMHKCVAVSRRLGQQHARGQSEPIHS